MRAFPRTCALVLLATAAAYASNSPDGAAYYTGDRPDVYIPLGGTRGNIKALQKINADFKALLDQGITPVEVGYYAAHPIHPVNGAGSVADDPSHASPEAIAIAPSAALSTRLVSGTGVNSPPDILQRTDPVLKARYFKGYGNLAATAGPGIMGETTFQYNPSGGAGANSQIAFQLDNRFLKSKTVILSPDSAVLTVSIQGGSASQTAAAQRYLASIRDTILAGIPPLLPVAAILTVLAGALWKKMNAWTKAQGWTDVVTHADVASLAVPEFTDEETVTIHEEQHALDYQRISQGTNPILPEYLESDSPFSAVAESLMEVRAFLAEINEDPTGQTVNILYGQQNASRLSIVLLGLMPLLMAEAPALLTMAQQDLAAAEVWLSAHVSEYINF